VHLPLFRAWFMLLVAGSLSVCWCPAMLSRCQSSVQRSQLPWWPTCPQVRDDVTVVLRYRAVCDCYMGGPNHGCQHTREHWGVCGLPPHRVFDAYTLSSALVHAEDISCTGCCPQALSAQWMHGGQN